MTDVLDSPWDHNGECLYCDEQGLHRADCPWLLRLIAEVTKLRQEQPMLETTIRNAVLDELDKRKM